MKGDGFQASKLGRRLELRGLMPYVLYMMAVARIGLRLVLWLSVPFLTVCYYYYNYFQWTHHPSPIDGLTYVTDADAPQLNEFRKRAVSSVTEPLRQQLEKLQKIRKRTNGGTFRPPGLERDLEEVRNRLREIVTEARLRRIPKQFRPKYEPALLAARDAFYSANQLEECFEQETESAKRKLYCDSTMKLKSAKMKCQETHNFFTSNEWQY